jgi:sugar/nucleoside kinase (ribokinase family)
VNVVVVGDLMVDVVAAHDAPLAIGSDTAARTLLQGGGAGERRGVAGRRRRRGGAGRARR